MARKLKTYQTSLGFFDLAVAAPFMKAAAEAWGLKTSEFKRGFAKERSPDTLRSQSGLLAFAGAWRGNCQATAPISQRLPTWFLFAIAHFRHGLFCHAP
jgi:hypothetical protein